MPLVLPDGEKVKAARMAAGISPNYFGYYHKGRLLTSSEIRQAENSCWMSPFTLAMMADAYCGNGLTWRRFLKNQEMGILRRVNTKHFCYESPNIWLDPLKWTKPELLAVRVNHLWLPDWEGRDNFKDEMGVYQYNLPAPEVFWNNLLDAERSVRICHFQIDPVNRENSFFVLRMESSHAEEFVKKMFFVPNAGVMNFEIVTQAEIEYPVDIPELTFEEMFLLGLVKMDETNLLEGWELAPGGPFRKQTEEHHRFMVFRGGFFSRVNQIIKRAPDYGPGCFFPAFERLVQKQMFGRSAF